MTLKDFIDICRDDWIRTSPATAGSRTTCATGPANSGIHPEEQDKFINQPKNSK